MRKAKARSKVKQTKKLAVNVSEGHLELEMLDADTIELLAPEKKATAYKFQGFIRSLMNAHNAMLDASRSLEVKSAAASLETTIDAKIERMNEFLSREINLARKNKKRSVKRSRVSKRKAA